MDIQWTPAVPGSIMAIILEGSCDWVDGGANHSDTFYHYVEVNDSGTAALNLAAISELQAFIFQGSCSEELTLKRENQGTLDIRFGEGGYIVTRQARQVAISITDPP